MNLSPVAETLLVLVVVLDCCAFSQRSLQAVPFTGVGSVRPLRSSSFSVSSTAISVGVNGSETELGRATSTDSSSAASEADVVDSVATNSSWSSGAANSSSSSSALDVFELMSTNSSAAVDDPVLTNSSASSTNISAVEQALVETLEEDQQVTVLGDVQLGELLCDSLKEAEDAPLLQFALRANETILANKSSYTEISGEFFTGGMGRRIWTGIVVDPAQAADEAYPREVSMTWSEVCDIEVEFNFLPYHQPLRVGSNSTGGSTPVRRRLGGGDLSGSSNVGHLHQPSFARSSAVAAGGPPPSSLGDRRRKLESSAVQLPYEEGSLDSATKLGVIRQNAEVMALRNEHEADLVVLVGMLYDVCGIAYVLPDTIAGYSEFAYSVVSPNCFDNLVLAHEFGHNLGCEHNREHSSVAMEYAHGYRYCQGTMYTTIMSYTEGCTTTRVNYFASPNISYLGQPTGTETENCARAIEENKVVVSNFRGDIADNPPGDGDDSFDFDEIWERGKYAFIFVSIGVAACFFLKRRCHNMRHSPILVEDAHHHGKQCVADENTVCVRGQQKIKHMTRMP